jgi:hypothetical protein
MQTRKREFWNGPPERMPDGFQLRKQKGDQVLTATAKCGRTHSDGNCGS